MNILRVKLLAEIVVGSTSSIYQYGRATLLHAARRFRRWAYVSDRHTGRHFQVCVDNLRSLFSRHVLPLSLLLLVLGIGLATTVLYLVRNRHPYHFRDFFYAAIELAL